MSETESYTLQRLKQLEEKNQEALLGGGLERLEKQKSADRLSGPCLLLAPAGR